MLPFRSAITRLDVVIVALSLSLMVGASVFAASQAAGKGELLIEAAGKQYAYDLSKNAVIHIPGSLGDSVITVENHQAFFVDSPCRDKLCVHKGHLITTGDWAACLPNRVIARIANAPASDSRNQVDAVTY